MSQLLNEIDKNYSLKINKKNKVAKESNNKKSNGINTVDDLDFNSKFSKINNDSKKENTIKKQAKFDLVSSLKSSLNSVTKDDMEWILNQEIEIDNTVKSLSSDEISLLIDYLKVGLDSFKIKGRCLDWFESILKVAPNKLSDKKLQELKCIIKPITLNHELLLETLSIFELIKDMSNIEELLDDKENFGKSDFYADKKHSKHKISVVYNESDSEEEIINKEKANILKKIEEKKKEKINLLKQKTKNKLINNDHEESIDDENSNENDMEFEDDEFDDDENSQNIDDEEEYNEEDEEMN